MNTRKRDLEALEEKRATDPRGRAYVTKMLNRIYHQSQDPVLERMRQAMIDAQKRGDLVAADRIAEQIRQRGR